MFESLSLLSSLSSLGGGAGGPSSAGGFPTYFSMNSPFSVATRGASASASLSPSGDSGGLVTMALVAVAVSALVVIVSK